jgi:tyrosine-protein kinase Etk/Wzc
VDPADPSAGALQGLRAEINLQVRPSSGAALLFTGVHAGDGTTTIASNYALSASAAGYSTLLIDANQAKPALHERLALERDPGLTDVVAGGIAFDDAVQLTTVGDVELALLPAGSPSFWTADVLGSEATSELIAAACDAFAVVVIDSPAVRAAPDAAVLSALPQVATVVVVRRHQRRRRTSDAVTQLRRAGANLVGFVVNDG